MALKLARIGDRPTKEKRITLTVDPYLAGQLELYGQAYKDEYGAEAREEEIILAILNQFFATDAGFKSYVKEKSGTKVRRSKTPGSQAQPSGSAQTKGDDKTSEST